MSSQLDTDLRTNSRNDAKAENCTTNFAAGDSFKRPESTTQANFEKGRSRPYTTTKCFVVKDIRKYKNKKIKLKALTGQYNYLERLNVCGRNITTKQIFDRLICELHDLDKMMQGSAQANWDPVGGFAMSESISKLAETAEQLNTNIHLTRDDMSSMTEEILKTMNNMTEKFMPNFDKVANAGVKVDHTYDFPRMLQMLDDPATTLVISAVIFLFLEIMERKFDVKDIHYIKILIAVFAIYKIGKPALKLFSDWLRPKTETTPQADWQDWLKVTVQGVLFVVLGCTLDFDGAGKIVKQLVSAANEATKLQELFTSILEWFKRTIYLVCKTFNVEVWDWLKPQESMIKKFMDSTNELLIEYTNDPMAIDVDFTERVTRLMMEINHYNTTISHESKNSPVLIAIKDLKSKMDVLYRNVVDAGMALGERFDPAFIPIAGAPKCGKTYFSEFLAQDLSIGLADTPIKLIEAQRNWKTNVYCWPADGKHHDMYKGEPITVFPDLFCQTDAEGQPSEASNLVYMIGGQPLQLPAAELTKKQRLFFVSSIVIACTNVTYMHPNMFKSVRNPDAVNRRMDEFGWYMWVHPDYAERDADDNIIYDKSTKKIKGHENDFQLYGRIDKNRIPVMPDGEFPDNLWLFRKYRFSTGEFSEGKIYLYEEFMNLCRQHSVSKRAEGNVKRDKLISRGNRIAQQRAAEMAVGPDVGQLAVAQMDGIELSSGYLGHNSIAREKQRVNRLRDIMCKISLDSMDESLEGEEVEAIHHEVDINRSTFSMYFANMFVRGYMSEAAHNKMKNYLMQTNRSLHNVSEAKLTAILNGMFGTDSLSAFNFTVMEHVLLAVKLMEQDPTMKDYIKPLRVDYIIQLALMPYESAQESYNGMKVKSIFKNNYIANVVLAQLGIKQMYDTYISPLVRTFSHNMNIVKDTTISLFYSKPVVAALEFITDNSFLLCMIPFLAFAETYMFTRIFRAETKAVTGAVIDHVVSVSTKELNLRNIEQSAWSDQENVKRTIDSHMVNFVGVYVIIHQGKETATRHPCNAVFLGGKYVIIVDHARQAIEHIREKVRGHPGHYVEIALIPFVGNTLKYSTERVLLDDVSFDSNPELEHYDLSIMTSKKFKNRPHIFDLIPPVQCLEWLGDKTHLEGMFVERPTNLNLEFEGEEKRVPVRFSFCNFIGGYQSTVSVYGETSELKKYSYQTLLMKGRDDNFITRAGYCTSPGFITDPRKNFCTKLGWPQAQQPWLCYLHTSLQANVPNGAPIFREMFTKWIDLIKDAPIKPVELVISENLEVYNSIISEELELIDSGQGNSFEIVHDVEKLDENHFSEFSMNHKLFQPLKTSIKRSPLFGIDPRTRYPSRMGMAKDLDGNLVDVMQKARTPYGRNTAVVNMKLVDEIIHQAMSRILTDSSSPKYRNLLTLDQIIYGDAAYNLAGLNWNSSMGFMFRLMKDKYNQTWKAKRWMLDEEGKVKPAPYRMLQRLFEHFNNKIMNGERIYAVNIDNLKDELLKTEKVKNADSRLFCTIDLIPLMLHKCHFGAFAGWIYENRIQNHIAIGVNPMGDEWTAIAEHLKSNSYDMLFMDHSKFDKDQIRQFMSSVLILMTMYYNDRGSVRERAREVLFEDIVNSLHVTMYKGKLYFYTWDQGNTSGNFLTAILNSLVNFCYMYTLAIFAWLLFQGVDPNKLDTLPPNPADKALKAIILGDDITVSVKRDIMPGVNFNSMCLMGVKYLNLKITDELKTEGVIPDFRTLEEGSFLGCMFIPEFIYGKMHYRARLRMYSVIENIQWCKGLTDPSIEVEKMENCFLKLSRYDKKTFDSIVSRYASACKEAYGVYPKFTEYDIARRHLNTLSEEKYNFYDFVHGDMQGVDICDIIFAHFKESLKYRCKPDFEVCDTSNSSGFDVKNTDYIVTGDKPRPRVIGVSLRA